LFGLAIEAIFLAAFTQHVTGGCARADARDEPVKLADHEMDAMRYALHGELGGAARTEAYLAAMQSRLRQL
jgi:hypothetical protein